MDGTEVCHVEIPLQTLNPRPFLSRVKYPSHKWGRRKCKKKIVLFFDRWILLNELNFTLIIYLVNYKNPEGVNLKKSHLLTPGAPERTSLNLKPNSRSDSTATWLSKSFPESILFWKPLGGQNWTSYLEGNGDSRMLKECCLRLFFIETENIHHSKSWNRII